MQLWAGYDLKFQMILSICVYVGAAHMVHVLIEQHLDNINFPAAAE